VPVIASLPAQAGAARNFSFPSIHASEIRAAPAKFYETT
jgi:hypothetical protein